MKKFFFEMIKSNILKTIIMYKASKKWDKMSDEAKNYTEAKDVYYDVAEEVNKEIKKYKSYFK